MELFISTMLIVCTAFAGVFFNADIYEYGGAIVVDFGNPMMQINGILWGGVNAHEYGHYLQQQQMGNKEYYAKVAIPSLLASGYYGLRYLIGNKGDAKAYLALPWEAEATRLGKQFIASY
jgi:hypothetical protein